LFFIVTYLQGRVKFPIGGKVRYSENPLRHVVAGFPEGTVETTVPTVIVWMEEDLGY